MNGRCGVSKQIRDLLEGLFETAYMDYDPRFAGDCWAKEITGIDPDETHSRHYTGKYVDKGTIEIDIKPRIYLVCIRAGSRKNNWRYFEVVLMNADGTLEATGIKDDDEKKGWELRMRPAIEELLAQMASNPVSPYQAIVDAFLELEVEQQKELLEILDKVVTHE